LSDITNIFNDSENINVCKKNSVDVYSKEGVSSVRIHEENTIWEVNRTGKNKSRGESKNDGCHI